jgi:HSP20 family protein
MDKVFEDFWRGFDLPALGRQDRLIGVIAPRVNVSENEKEIVVTAELPGMTPEDIEVVYADGTLMIKGEKKAEKEEKEERGYTYHERNFGSFQRILPFGAEFIEDKITATLDNGLLTVVLPKSPEAQKKYRKVVVKTTGPEPKQEKKAA